MTRSAPWILGLSYSHNGSACLLRGDEIVVAIQEERLLGLKRATTAAQNENLCVSYCLEYAGIGPADLDCVVVSAQDGNHKHTGGIAARAGSAKALAISHHLAHAVSVFATSGFEEAAVLIVDGMGGPFSDFSDDERAATKHRTGHEIVSTYHARGTTVRALEKHVVEGGKWLDLDHIGRRRPGMPRFASLGGMFSSVAHLVFGDLTEAGKVMGLAPYGQPTIDPSEFFDLVGDEIVFRDRVLSRFPESARWPANEREYADLCASAQLALEKALTWLAARARSLTGSDRLCYAGGVALNSVANELLVNTSGFERVYVIPSAEDSGCAIGCAYHGLWSLLGTNARRPLGPDAVGRSYPRTEVMETIGRLPGLNVVSVDDVASAAADRIAAGEIVGWFQGGSELGPRALGQRSILCDPRRDDGKDTLNARVKHREAFRPFAPAILLEKAGDWFEPSRGGFESPYMLRVLSFKPDGRALVPAVVHVDGTGRVQTVTKENGRYRDLIERFDAKTGVPIVLNTSFNLMGEPIVETPEDALWCLLLTGLDCCVVGDVLVEKDPRFPAALDLIPRTIAKTTMDVRDGTVGLVAEVSTPWGASRVSIAPGAQLMVELIDGRRTWRSILGALCAAGATVSESDVMRTMAALRRMRVITLSTG